MSYVLLASFYFLLNFNNRPRPKITILAEEYGRLLIQESLHMKCKESCKKKAAEIKRLQDQLIHYKKQVLMLRAKQNDDQDVENKRPTLVKVNLIN